MFPPLPWPTHLVVWYLSYTEDKSGFDSLVGYHRSADR